MAKRLTTVHDLTALRVHADGSRVSASGKRKRDRNLLQDQRGNIIATDAAGFLGVKRRHTVDGEEDEEEVGEVFDLTGVDELMRDVEPTAMMDKGKGKAVDAEGSKSRLRPKSWRKQKREQFLADLSFLDSQPADSFHASRATSVVREVDLTNDASVTGLASVKALPSPSSELLKCIHHMASKYYHEMGQLEDVTREARRERRRRRRLKLSASQPTGKKRGDSADDSSEDDEGPADDISVPPTEVDVDEEARAKSQGTNTVNEEEPDDGGDKSSQDSDESDCEPVDEWKAKYADQDMYKMFDGSALMAIGMLLQEYVADLVNVQQRPHEEDAKPAARRRRRSTDAPVPARRGHQ
ncbi:hypothetical protein BXZ70DRAFT_945304 [Cristinia sonorae]|uniref:Uncharacterized protein n=1 Tax=Cristinia sonorae TaxID=1940300 RepID=A0A8K0UMC0_9AGAR|nr:hypothetical protein BXZ70DRAFT_945304 [Cristinia sonorae]